MSNTAFHLYGDESVSNNIVMYGVVAVRPDIEQCLEDQIKMLKKEYGAAEGVLHCNVIFNGDRRNKSVWHHLKIEECFDLYHEFVEILNAHQTLRLGVYADKTHIPRKIPPLESAPQSLSFNLVLDDKQLGILCANATQEPFAKQLGLDRVRFWADPDDSKVAWLGSKRKVKRSLDMFFDLPGHPRVTSEPIGRNKPILLEAADLLAYATAKSLSTQVFRDKSKYEELHKFLNPNLGQIAMVNEGNGAFLKIKPPVIQLS